jgi:hypothetical protein
MNQFIPILLLICCSCGPSDSKHNLVPCDVAGYLFTLGEPVSETLKNWPDLKDYSYRFLSDTNIQQFSDTYEEHSFGFTFYNNELIRADLTIPLSEFNPAIIKMGEEIIQLNAQVSNVTFVNDLNCMISCLPFDYEGIKNVQLIIKYQDANDLLDKGVEE